jgi:hypothetical protein
MAAATMHGGEYAGWIYKQGSLVRSWKKRFMVLRGKQLTYYDTERITPRVKEKGSFQVITAELSSEIQNGLLVHGRGGRVLKLYTDSAESTTNWYHAIMDAMGMSNGGGSMSLSMGSSDRFSLPEDSIDLDDAMDLVGRMSSMPLDDTQVQHSGWLRKEGMRVKSWKKRWFTLRGETLSYFDSADTGSSAKGYGHVRAVEVNGEMENSLDIRFDSGRILRVAAESPRSMQDWLLKISDAIEAARDENNNARQSLAFRQNMRASISGPPPVHRGSIVGGAPMRHSIADPTMNPSQETEGPVRPSIATMKGFGRSVPSSDPLERRRSSNDSYNNTNLTAQSSNISSNQSEYFYDSDSDSDGDWI